MDRRELARWETRLRSHLELAATHDAAHDLMHVHRVVRLAERIAGDEGAALEIVLPAALLHDLISLPKDHPDRAQASRLSADAASAVLADLAYPAPLVPAIAHCIETHSFSAKLDPGTLEARIVQDADRLDALGAIGIARCFATSGAMKRPFYDEDDPFACNRPLDDLHFALDHFEKKLFRVAETLHTKTARTLAAERVAFMRSFLDHFREEIHTQQSVR